MLSEEFFRVTGKTIEIKDNSYYHRLIEITPETKEPLVVENIPNIEQLREEIQSVIGDLCTTVVENFYGDFWDEATFTVFEYFDASYIESVFKDLKNIISAHLFEQSVPASQVFRGNDQIVDGKVDISLSALESAMRLYDTICQKYPDYLQQFFSATVRILNRNYREAYVKTDENGELPF